MIVKNKSWSKLEKSSVREHVTQLVSWLMIISAAPNLYPLELIKLCHFELFVTLIYERMYNCHMYRYVILL